MGYINYGLLLTMVHVHIATEVPETPSWGNRPVFQDQGLVGDIDRIS